MNRRRALGTILATTSLTPLAIAARESKHTDHPHHNKDIQVRKATTLSDDWRFQIDIDDVGEKESWFEKNYSEVDWTNVQVPLAWDCYDEGMWGYEGIGWYKTTINADILPDTHLVIEFGRVMIHSKVWVNNHFLGESTNGYLPFDFDVTAFIKPGADNTITVRADNRPKLEWLPAASDIEWMLYGGILRKVVLYTISNTFINDLAITTSGNGRKAVVHCVASVSNKTMRLAKMELVVEITRDNRVVRKSVTIRLDANSTRSVAVDLDIDNPLWWSPGTPTLYAATAVLSVGGKAVDDVRETFGIRTVATSGTSILLNGSPLVIKGVNRYDDYARLGPTPSEAIVREELELIRSTGVNMIRVHYPQTPELLSLYDEYGFLMMEELPFCWWGGKEVTQTTDILSEAKPALSKMIRRDKNHPCIVIWSMSNECITVTEAATTVMRDLMEQARKMDSSRLITYVINGYEDPAQSRALDQADVIVVNKYYGSIQGTPSRHIADIEKNGYQAFVDIMRKHRKDLAAKPMFIGEFGSPGIRNIHGDQYYSEEFQAAYIKRLWEGIRDVEGLSGGILWCWADYYQRLKFIQYTAFGPYGVVTVDRKPKKSLTTLKEMFGGKD